MAAGSRLDARAGSAGSSQLAGRDERTALEPIASGVFGRQPRLRFAVTELGANWVSPIQSVMDRRFGEKHVTANPGDHRGEPRLPPCEHLDRNVRIDSSFAPRTDVEALAPLVERIGAPAADLASVAAEVVVLDRSGSSRRRSLDVELQGRRALRRCSRIASQSGETSRTVVSPASQNARIRSTISACSAEGEGFSRGPDMEPSLLESPSLAETEPDPGFDLDRSPIEDADPCRGA